MARKKIGLVGGGQIGGILALLAAQRELGDVVVVDIPDKESFVKGKALDIMESTPVLGCDADVSGTGNYADIKGADVNIVTAGLPRKPGMSREDLLDTNIKIITVVAENIKKYAPDSFNIILWIAKIGHVVYGMAGIHTVGTPVLFQTLLQVHDHSPLCPQ